MTTTNRDLVFTEGQVEPENLKVFINNHPIEMNHGSNNGTYSRQY